MAEVTQCDFLYVMKSIAASPHPLASCEKANCCIVRTLYEAILCEDKELMLATL